MQVNDVIHKYDGTEAEKALIVGDHNDGERDYVLIEGTAEALRFVAELLMAHANDHQSLCDWSMSPRGGGFRWFDDRSPKGLAFHRVPCEHGSMLTGE